MSCQKCIGRDICLGLELLVRMMLCGESTRAISNTASDLLREGHSDAKFADALGIYLYLKSGSKEIHNP